MTTYSNTFILESPETLLQAMATQGIYDGVFNITEDYDADGNPLGTCTVIIDTAIGTQTQIDNTIADSTVGSFFGNKAHRIKEILDKSTELSEDGAYFTRPSDAATNKGPLELSYDSRSRIYNLIQDISNGSVPMPQMIDTTDGRGVVVYTQADAEAAYQAILDRGLYILNAGQNSDSSYGENGYILLINQSADQAALDAIQDTRT